MVHGILPDLIFAARSLMRTRGVTALAVVSLAIGIAANATVFSVVSALEFPRLIYPDASRLGLPRVTQSRARTSNGMLVSAPDALGTSPASARTLDAADSPEAPLQPGSPAAGSAGGSATPVQLQAHQPPTAISAARQTAVSNTIVEKIGITEPAKLRSM